MGIENRDYYRDSSRPSSFGGFGGGISPICKYLLVITVVVYVGQIMITRKPTLAELQAYGEAQIEYSELQRIAEEEGIAPDRELVERALTKLQNPPREVSVLQEWLELDTKKVMRGQVWRLLTCAFLHNPTGVWHIVVNMLFLFWFGVTLESMYGSREFLYFYLTAAVIASIAFVGLDLYLAEYIPAIGASGAVMAVTMLYAIHFPRDRILLFMFIPVEVRVLVFFYVIFDLHPILLKLGGYDYVTGTAHAAHLGGLAFGYLYWRYGLRLSQFFDRFRLPMSQWLVSHRANQRGFKVYDPDHEPLQTKPPRDRRFDAKLDDILDKVHQHGKESLTEAERDFLDMASERYRKKNGDG